MGRIFVVELEGRSYRCKFCKTHLALASDCVSRGFHCRRGKAYLFSNVPPCELRQFSYSSQHNDFPNKRGKPRSNKIEWKCIKNGPREIGLLVKENETPYHTPSGSVFNLDSVCRLQDN